MVYYYEIINGKIYETNYPITTYVIDEIVQDSPLVTKGYYYTDDYSYEPFYYKKNKDSISMFFFDYGKNQWTSQVNYILNQRDSVSPMASKSNLIRNQTKNQIFLDSKSKYLGKRIVIIEDNPRQTYCFEENNKRFGNDVRHYELTEIYIDSATLIPVQFIRRKYNMKDVYTNYYSITKVQSLTADIPFYTDEKDLIVYDNKSLKWTQKQREWFLEKYAQDDPEGKSYINCILDSLDGMVSFYDCEQSRLFKTITLKSKCDVFIQKK